MQIDGDLKTYQISHFDINSQGQSFYEPYQLKVQTGFGGQYLICINKQGTTNSFNISSSGQNPTDWYNFSYSGFDFSQVWTPTYQVQSSPTPQVKSYNFGDGYINRQNLGLNQNVIVWTFTFEDVTDLEATQLLAFQEHKGGVGTFKFTIPAPYNTPKWMRITQVENSYQSYGCNILKLTMNEVYQEGQN